MGKHDSTEVPDRRGIGPDSQDLFHGPLLVAHKKAQGEDGRQRALLGAQVSGRRELLLQRRPEGLPLPWGSSLADKHLELLREGKQTLLIPRAQEEIHCCCGK